MKFPINREKLQNIKKDVEEEIIQCNIEEIIENTKVRIIAHAYQGTISHLGGISNTKLKIEIYPFRIIIPDNLKRYIQLNHYLASINPWKTHFEIIKETLMELFPGVSFETDPLKTYVLIDWS
jgi:hypothetical protein